ncbi:acyltransferase [Escherichia coli]|uniref:acyltransferase family protein n=1 Tax=Escherichia coli TaxID=562 RepID=UPI001BD32956|nr:acyltransferase family protein [Escherichia coli]MBS9622050.1 acyltransferase [Escherichia coli]
MNYRKELDGLRAIAVFAVMLYHSGITLFGHKILPGGFLGVDVFFVLSGFLITTIIRSGINKDSFSVIDFYWRRIKRIYPALILMLVSVSVIAYVYLLPADLESFSKSLFGALTFTSNHFFLSEDSYTAAASVYKPLLHTWTLGVEWQFYMMFPFIMILIKRISDGWQLVFISFLAIISFAASQYMISGYKDTVFYLLPYRAWELLVGSIASYIINYHAIKIIKLRDKIGIISLISFVALVLSLILVNDSFAHPSYVTIIPVASTLMIITFSNERGIVFKALSLKPVVFIGVISYSVYLWHQPVFVFYRILINDSITMLSFLFLAMSSIIMGYASYKTIEQPFRSSGGSKIKLTTLTVPAVALCSFSFISISANGFPSRLEGNISKAYSIYDTLEYARLIDSKNIGENYKGEKSIKCDGRTVATACRFGDEKWITVGDSFVGQYENEINMRVSGLIAMSYQQCPYVSSNYWFGTAPECSEINKERDEFFKKIKGKHNILITANYEQFFNAKKKTNDPIGDANRGFSGGIQVKDKEIFDSFADNINKLIDSGHDVYLIYSTPKPGVDVKSIVFKQMRSTNSKYKETFTNDDHSWRRAEYIDHRLDLVIKDRKGLHKIYPKDILCKDKLCMLIGKDGGLYNGGDHLSSVGVTRIISGNL